MSEPLRFLFVSYDALITDIAWQVVKEGHEVRYSIDSEADRAIMERWSEKVLANRDTRLDATEATLREQLQQIRAAVQDSAIQANPDLQEQQQEVQETVTAAMIELNPELEESMDRLPELQQEAMQAQANQDTTRLQALVQEGNRIQAAMTQAQAQVMQQPAIQAELEDFRAELLDAMVEIRPGIEDTLARMEQLGARLQATQGAMQGGGSGD